MSNNSPTGLKYFFPILSGKWAGIAIMTVLSALLYYNFFISRAYIEFEYSTDHDTSIQVMWAEEGNDYTRANSGTGRLNKKKKKCGFFLTDLRKMRYLRLDPMGRTGGTVNFRKITLSQPGMQPVVFSEKEDFKRFLIGTDISGLSFAPGIGWTVTSDGGNPNLHLILEPPEKQSFNLPVQSGRFLVLLLIFYLIFRAFTPYLDDFNYISLLAAGVVLLVLVMALTTLNDHHPDEMVHAAAAAYYEDHWLMPAVESPEIAATYSGYGFSRLNSKEICYFLTGKFASLLEDLHLPSYQRYRFFNVLLLTTLVLLTFQTLTARLIFIPFLMTPQVWYIFSYYNSDAFSLFTATIAACQVTDQKSLFNRYLTNRTGIIKPALLLGLLVGALLLTKKNYYFFLIFIFLYMAIEFAFKRYQFSWAVWKKLLILACIGLSLFTFRYGLDVSVNGFDKGTKIQKLREQRAHHIYKPSTSLAEKHPNLHIRARGIGFQEYLSRYRWGGKIIRSFYGVYGYMTVSGVTTYYAMMRNTGYLFLGFIFLTVVFRGNFRDNALLLNTTVCCLALIGMACYRAWIMDFQAQGRYLLVILPMLGVLIARTQQLFQPLILRSFIAFMFTMSLYNYVFIGLNNLAKHGWG